MQILKRFVSDESGATAIEYGLIVTLIAMVAAAGFRSLGTSLDARFNDIASCVSDPTGVDETGTANCEP